MSKIKPINFPIPKSYLLLLGIGLMALGATLLGLGFGGMAGPMSFELGMLIGLGILFAVGFGSSSLGSFLFFYRPQTAVNWRQDHNNPSTEYHPVKQNQSVYLIDSFDALVALDLYIEAIGFGLSNILWFGINTQGIIITLKISN